MELSDDEIIWVSAILYNSKSKILLECPEAKIIADKLCNESRKITATRSQNHIKPGKWS